MDHSAAEKQETDHHPTDNEQELDHPDRLPTYHELQEKEGHRFGRWKGWIEKRARERMEERAIDRREAESQGRSFGTGWDLPNPTDYTQPQLNRNSSIISSQDERAAFHSASKNHRDAFSARHEKGRSEGSSNHRFHLEPAPGAVNLTPSTSIHPIGSRFLPQFPSQPLCAIPLPLGSQLHNSNEPPPVDRFLLVGTIDGLYVCDLIPSLSSTVKRDSVSPTDSKIYQIWQGLGIHQLEIAIENPIHFSKKNLRPTSSTTTTSPSASKPPTLPGIVIALTSSTLDSKNSSLDGISKLIKMWPLQSIVNLVKFRAFSEHSECLELTEEPPISKRDSTLTIGTSALAGLKSMFEKGKHKAGTSISSMTDVRQAGFPSNTNGPSNRNASGSISHQVSSDATSESSPKPNTKTTNAPSHLELPLQWAKQTISLNLPRIQANGPILFIKLSNSPCQGFNPINDQFDQSFDSTSVPIALRPRSYVDPDHLDIPPSTALPNDGWWYLIIATKQLIFIMESQPAPQRTWHLCAEMSAPFTAKTANLVLSEFPKAHSNKLPSSSRSLPSSRRPNHHRPGVGELSVLLTMKEYAVVISMSDLSVRELDLQGTLATSQTTTSLVSNGPTLKPTSGSFSGLDHLDRIPFARNLPSIAGGSVEPILTKRIKEIGINNEGFQVENRRSNTSVQDRRWAGCEELLIPVPTQTRLLDGNPREDALNSINYNLRVVYLITRGYLTHAVMCPFGYKSRPRTPQRNSFHSSLDQSGGMTGGVPPPLLLKPFHTFTWKAIPVKVHARIIPTPTKWEKRTKRPQHQRQSTSGGFPFPREPPEEVQHQEIEEEEEEEIFCCLTAFSGSSIEVQEGFISLKYLRKMWEVHQVRSNNSKKLGREDENFPKSFFTPASQRVRRGGLRSNDSSTTVSSLNSISDKTTSPPSTSTSTASLQSSDSDDCNDQSSYDYSAKIGYLCSSTPRFFPPPLPPPPHQNQNQLHSHQLERNPDSCDSDRTLTIDLNKEYPLTSSINSNIVSSLNQNQNQNLIQNQNLNQIQGSFFCKQAVGEWKIMYVSNS